MSEESVKYEQLAKPEKMWSELADNEKLERMHGVVQILSERIYRAESVIHELSGHRHGADGVVLSPFKNRRLGDRDEHPVVSLPIRSRYDYKEDRDPWF